MKKERKKERKKDQERIPGLTILRPVMLMAPYSATSVSQ
jgi:hypothetical protein